MCELSDHGSVGLRQREADQEPSQTPINLVPINENNNNNKNNNKNKKEINKRNK